MVVVVIVVMVVVMIGVMIVVVISVMIVAVVCLYDYSNIRATYLSQLLSRDPRATFCAST